MRGPAEDAALRRGGVLSDSRIQERRGRGPKSPEQRDTGPRPGPPWARHGEGGVRAPWATEGDAPSSAQDDPGAMRGRPHGPSSGRDSPILYGYRGGARARGEGLAARDVGRDVEYEPRSRQPLDVSRSPSSRGQDPREHSYHGDAFGSQDRTASAQANPAGAGGVARHKQPVPPYLAHPRSEAELAAHRKDTGNRFPPPRGLSPAPALGPPAVLAGVPGSLANPGSNSFGLPGGYQREALILGGSGVRPPKAEARTPERPVPAGPRMGGTPAAQQPRDQVPGRFGGSGSVVAPASGSAYRGAGGPPRGGPGLGERGMRPEQGVTNHVRSGSGGSPFRGASGGLPDGPPGGGKGPGWPGLQQLGKSMAGGVGAGGPIPGPGSGVQGLGSSTGAGSERSRILKTTLLNMAKRNRGRPEIHLYLGLLHLRENDFVKATSAFQAAVESVLALGEESALSPTRTKILATSRMHLTQCALALAALKEEQRPAAKVKGATEQQPTPASRASPMAPQSLGSGAHRPSGQEGSIAKSADRKAGNQPVGEDLNAAREGEPRDANCTPARSADAALDGPAPPGPGSHECRLDVQAQQESIVLDMNMEAPPDRTPRDAAVEARPGREGFVSPHADAGDVPMPPDKLSQDSAGEKEPGAQQHLDQEQEKARAELAYLLRDEGLGTLKVQYGGFAESISQAMARLRDLSAEQVPASAFLGNIAAAFLMGHQFSIVAAFMSSLAGAPGPAELSLEMLVNLGAALLHLARGCVSADALQAALRKDPLHVAALGSYASLLLTQPHCVQSPGVGCRSTVGSGAASGTVEAANAAYNCLRTALAVLPGASPLWAALASASSAAISGEARGTSAPTDEALKALVQAAEVEPSSAAVRYAVAQLRLRSAVRAPPAPALQQLQWARNELRSLMDASVPSGNGAGAAAPASIPHRFLQLQLSAILHAEAQVLEGQLSTMLLDESEDVAPGLQKTAGPAAEDSSECLKTVTTRIGALRKARDAVLLEKNVEESAADGEHGPLRAADALAFYSLHDMEPSTAQKYALEHLTGGKPSAESTLAASWNLGVALSSHSEASRAGGAQGVLERVLALAQGMGRPLQGVLTNLSIHHRRAGDVHLAREAAEAALRVCPSYAPAMNALGLVHVHMDNLGQALACFRQAAMADPELEAAWSNERILTRAVHGKRAGGHLPLAPPKRRCPTPEDALVCTGDGIMEHSAEAAPPEHTGPQSPKGEEGSGRQGHLRWTSATVVPRHKTEESEEEALAPADPIEVPMEEETSSIEGDEDGDEVDPT